MDTLLASHPFPPAAERLHPLEALRAVRRLLADPGDTRQVFVVLRAMRGRSGERMFARFAADPSGQALLHARPDLLAQLTDAALARMPAGSLGCAYLRFMGETGLAGGGLVAAQAAAQDRNASMRGPVPDGLAFLRARMRDQHDLLHVVTGYGADPLGELCLLAFTYAQTGHVGMAMIAVLGCLRIGFGPAGRVAWRAVWQAWRDGRRASWLPAVAWEAVLDRPLAEVRAELHVPGPRAAA